MKINLNPITFIDEKLIKCTKITKPYLIYVKNVINEEWFDFRKKKFIKELSDLIFYNVSKLTLRNKPTIYYQSSNPLCGTQDCHEVPLGYLISTKLLCSRPGLSNSLHTPLSLESTSIFSRAPSLCCPKGVPF